MNKAGSTGAQEIDDLMSGNGDHSVSINRDSKANSKLNKAKTLTNPYIKVDEEEDIMHFENKASDGTAQNGFRDDMTILECFWEITKLATPMIFGMFVYLMVMLVNCYFIGHLNDPVLLAGVGMGNMLINVLCFAVVQGLNGALETLVS